MKKTLEDIKEYLHPDLPYHELDEIEILLLLSIINGNCTNHYKKEARHILENYKTEYKWRKRIK